MKIDYDQLMKELDRVSKEFWDGESKFWFYVPPRLLFDDLKDELEEEFNNALENE